MADPGGAVSLGALDVAIRASGGPQTIAELSKVDAAAKTTAGATAQLETSLSRVAPAAETLARGVRSLYTAEDRAAESATRHARATEDVSRSLVRLYTDEVRAEQAAKALARAEAEAAAAAQPLTWGQRVATAETTKLTVAKRGLAVAARQSGAGLAGLIPVFNGMAARAFGLEQTVGTLFGTLAPGMIGGTLTGGLLLGLTAIGVAFKLMGDKAEDAGKRTAEAFKKIRESAPDKQDAGDVAGLTADARRVWEGLASSGVAGVDARGQAFFKGGLADLRARIAAAQAQMDQALRERNLLFAASLKFHISALKKQAAPIEKEFADLTGRIIAKGPGVTSSSDPVTAAAKRAVEQTGREIETARSAMMARLLRNAQTPGVGLATWNFGATTSQMVRALNDALKQAPPVALPNITIEPNALTQARMDLVKEFADIGNDIQSVLGDSIGNAFRALGSGEGPGGAIKAFGASLLSGFGEILVNLGKQTLAASGLMAAIRAAFSSLNPVAMAAAGAGLIALGSFIGGMGDRAMGGRGGGAGSYGGGYQASYAAPADWNLSARAMPKAAEPRTVLAVNQTIIGPNDPRAMRTIKEMIVNADNRRITGKG